MTKIKSRCFSVAISKEVTVTGEVYSKEKNNARMYLLFRMIVHWGPYEGKLKHLSNYISANVVTVDEIGFAQFSK